MCSLISSALGRSRPSERAGVNAIVVNHIAAVPVEQHEYSPMRRGQRARYISAHHPMSAPVDIAGPIERVCECNFLPQRSHSATIPPPTAKARDSNGGMVDWSFTQAAGLYLALFRTGSSSTRPRMHG
jgi:hypothetical protein